ncbi:MAG TPA: uroporphyrinogen-III synthase [Christiangramia sp.]|nr:uroporphyrinogen-III synthase [Christiangramia sp.]
MPTILSTKKLALNQKELLLNSGIGLVEYDAIKIKFIDFNLESEIIENAIFTSKNAVKAIEKRDLQIENCFCVGEKTRAYLEGQGFKVLENAENAKDLALKIINSYKDREFQFFSGNKRRDELPDLFRRNKIKYKEVNVYKTDLNAKKFESQFDGILFFSPSGVQSFTQNNKISGTAFCIGETTATEARNHTETIIVATKPTIENVITKVVSHFRNK